MPCSRDAAEPARPSVALAPAAARQQAEAPVELRVLREAAGPGLPAAAAADGGKAFGEEDDGKSEESLPSYMRADMSDSGAIGNSQDSRLDETYPSLSPERLASHELL
ncbi:hypothetical protein DIPPA_04155 [Diplonema papillatum]|nr:hypothetical protein DIPPA_04155 [Diplonema papillatum]